ncbi:hypothetical protein EPI10_029981 [Gossypium australe]|uniref:Uncharacterized protein n=1 Tax=Gossypium australe TaxID=47621 RepID=A0A5B6WX06_9ROSI|nr:hypothetical protein EPI10_029981 [Gossypium australe]
MTFPHISKIFVLGGTIHPEQNMSRNVGKSEHQRYPKMELGKRIYQAFALMYPGVSLDINNMSDTAADSESPFEQDMCMEDSQDFEDDQDCNLSFDLLRMKQILPYKESAEIVSLGEENEVKIGACIAPETKRDLIELLQEFKDVFAWSYQDMLELNIDIVVHRLPIKEECKPVQ